MEAIESIAALIVTISILVTIHEYGHYWVARRCGVKVLRFSVGFGKPLFTWRGKPVPATAIPEGQEIKTRSNELVGTEFVIAAIPLGGYVKMLDEREGFVADDELHLAFNRKSVWQRIAIVLAGPLANFMLAIAAYWILFTVGVTGIVPLLGDIDTKSKAGIAGFSRGQEIIQVDGEDTSTWSEVNLQLFRRIGDTGRIHFEVEDSFGEPRNLSIPIESWLADAETPYPTTTLGLMLNAPTVPAVIGRLIAGGRALDAGLQVGDQILASDFTGIETWDQWVDIIKTSPNRELQLEVRRDGTRIYISLIPESITRDGTEIGYIGAAAQYPEIPEEMQRIVRHPIYTAWIPALVKTWDMSVFTLDSIQKMILGAISTSNLSGPITIAKVASASARSGLESYIGFIAILSISLGVLNLLPIPILDGGHFLYYLIELISGHPVSERIQMLGMQLGIFIIVSIMLLAFYNDLARF
jgi:regulator of sigma E protease